MASKIVRNPIFLGVLIGFLAALFQAIFSSLGGPEAYGFCVACHTRDLVNEIFNMIFSPSPSLGMAPISSAAIFASLAIVGVILGGFISAKVNKEFKWKKGSLVTYVLYFFGGMAVMIFALLLGACPYRAALRLGYGDLVAGIGILAMALGVWVVSIIMLKRSEKEVV